jgi:hypothetical protein
MRQVTASLFVRQFGAYQHDAHFGAVEVTSHGRTTGFFLSPEEFALFDELRGKARRNLRTGELPPDIVEGLRTTKMDARHEHLNDLLK